MGWILEFVGVIVGSAVIPITLAVTSAHVSPHFTTWAPPVGTICAVCAWLGVTEGLYGEVNVTTTFENWPMFAGCVTALTIPLIMWLGMRPFLREQYDWDLLFLMIPRQPRTGDISFTHDDDDSLGLDWDPQELSRASFMAKTVSGVLCLIFLIVIPFPMYGSGYIMSRKFFTGWTVVVFIWSWSAALLIWCMPVWQSRGPLLKVARGIYVQFSGKSMGNKAVTPTETVNSVEVGGEEEVKHVPKEG
jgi:hypothetical protein